VLSRANSPDNPIAHPVGAGNRARQARQARGSAPLYASALRIVPDEPSVLSNLGLPTLLTRELPKAKKRCAAPMQRAGRRAVRQNLALVAACKAAVAKAESIVKADLPADEAAANVTYILREMTDARIARALLQPGARKGGRGLVALGQGD